MAGKSLYPDGASNERLGLEATPRISGSLRSLKQRGLQLVAIRGLPGAPIGWLLLWPALPRTTIYIAWAMPEPTPCPKG